MLGLFVSLCVIIYICSASHSGNLSEILPNAEAFGSLDVKITSYWLLMNHYNNAVLTRSGPAHSTADTPPFDWRNPKFVNISHVGMPDVWNFDYQVYCATPSVYATNIPVIIDEHKSGKNERKSQYLMLST